MADPSIYDQLAKESLSDLTVTQLNAGSSVTAVDQATIDYWRGPITLARILESSRTYAGGTLPIPEAGGIETVSVGKGESGLLRPTGTEVWMIQGIFGTGVAGTAVGSLFWFDGTNSVAIDSGQNFTTAGNNFQGITQMSGGNQSSTPPLPGAQPLTITNSLYLSFAETGGTYDITFTVAYHKVSL